MVVRETEAVIRLADTAIDSSGSVTVAAETKTGARPVAIATPVGKTGVDVKGKTYTAGDGQLINGVQFAGAAGTARSTVAATLEGSTSITAVNDVQINATGDVAIKGSAKAKAMGTQQGTVAADNVTDDNNAKSTSLLVTFLDYDASVTAGATTAITSKTGNVNIIAKGTTANEAKSSVSGDKDVTGAVAASVVIDKARVTTSIDGSVSAGASTSGTSGGKKFVKAESATAVDIATDIITLKDHGYVNGQKVLYTAAVEPEINFNTVQKRAIVGLTDGSWYYIRVVDQDRFQLTTAAPIDLTADAVGATSVHSLSTTDARVATLQAVEPKAGSNPATIRVDQGHGFTDGDEVRYDAEGSGAISGLTNGAVYTVSVVDDLRFALKDQSGALVEMSGAGAIGNHVFTSTRAPVVTTVPATDVAVDIAADTLTAAGHGFRTGDVVTYATTATAIGGLTAGTSYVVVAGSADTFQLRAAGGTLVDIGAIGTGSHSFTLKPKVADLTLMGVDAVTDAIILKGHGFSTDPAKPTTVYYSLVNSTDEATIGGLEVGGAYRVQVVDADRFKLVDATTGNTVDLSVPAAGGQHQLSFVKDVTNFVAKTAVNGTKDEITIAAHGFQSGDQVIYRVDPTVTRQIVQQTGDPLAPTRTISAPDSAIGGLTTNQVYYVVRLDANRIQLVESPTDIAAVDLTGLGKGNRHTFTDGGLTVGIGIRAILESKIRNEAEVEIGAKANPLEGAFTAGNAVGAEALSGVLDVIKELRTDDKAKTAKTNTNGTAQKPTNGGLSLGGAVTVTYASHEVSATVGKGATAGDRATLTSGGDIDVIANVQQKAQITSKSFLSKPVDPTGAQTGSAADKPSSVAVSVAVYNNASEARIAGTADLDAVGKTSVKAETAYPFITPLKDYWSNYAKDIKEKPGSGLKDLLDGTGGFDSRLMNSWTTAMANTAAAGSVGYSGSISVLVYSDEATASVDDGARINQRGSAASVAGVPIQPRDDQSVAVEASTLRELIDIGGLGRWKVDLGAGYTLAKQGVGKAITGGDVVSLGNRTGGGGVGGAFVGGFYDTKTVATISGAAAVTTGRSGTLDVKATEKLTRLQLVQSGATTGGDGAKSTVSGSVGVMVNDSETYAGLATGPAAGPTIAGGGAVTIASAASGTQINVVGTLVQSGGKGASVGASALVINNNRDVASFIGASPDASTTPTGAVSIAAGSLAVDARLRGSINNVVVSGTAKTDAENKSQVSSANPANKSSATQAPAASQTPAQTSLTDDVDEDLFGSLSSLLDDGSAQAKEFTTTPRSSGAGYAGAANIYIASEAARAYVNAAGAINAGKVTVQAVNDTDVMALTGGVTYTSGQTGGSAMAGAFAVNVILSDVQAFIANRTALPSQPSDPARDLTITLTDGAAVSDLLVDARRAGDVVNLSMGVGVTRSASGSGFGGSVAANALRDDVSAYVDGAAIRSAAGATGVDAKINASNSFDLLNIAGGLGGSTNAMAVGAAIAVNWLSSSTKAEIRGDRRRTTLAVSGDLDMAAANDQRIDSYSIGAAANTAGVGANASDTTALGFTMSLNFIDSQSQLAGDAGGVRAGIANADVTAGSVSAAAKDLSGITTIAGGLGVKAGSSVAKGNGIGAALAVNKTAVNTSALVDNARVTSTSGGVAVTAVSDDSTELIDGKIVSAAIGAAVDSGGSTGSAKAIGASLSLNIVDNAVTAGAINGAVVKAASGDPSRAPDISFTASDDALVRALTGGAALSLRGGGTAGAVGAAIAINVVTNAVTAKIDQSTAEAGGNVFVVAREATEIQALAIGAAGGKSFAAGGSITANYVSTSTRAVVTGAASQVEAQGSAQVRAVNDGSVMVAAGGLGVSSDSTAIGGAVTAVVVNATTEAFVDGAATVSAVGLSDFAALSGDRRAGVGIEASSTGRVQVFAVAGAAALASNGAFAGAATLSVINETVTARIGDRPAAASGGRVSSRDAGVLVAARGDTALTGVAGALAGSKKLGVGLGADVGVLTRTVEASIGGKARIDAKSPVIVDATGSFETVGVSAALAAASQTAVGASAGISALKLTTRAFIGSEAQVDTEGSISVAAEDDLDATTASVNAAISGKGAASIPLVFSVIDKTTESFIDKDATVTAAGLSGVGARSTAFDAPLKFAASAVNADTITKAGHLLSTGDEVVYLSDNALSGLTTEKRYFVIRVSDTAFKLAATRDDALAGTAIALGLDGGRVKATDTSTLRRVATGTSDARVFGDADLTASTIKIKDHGFSNGQEVVYTTGDTALGGLKAGARYFVRVVDADTIALATSRANALSSDVSKTIALKDRDASRASGHTLLPKLKTAGPTIDLDGAESSAVVGERSKVAGAEEFRGVNVSAISTTTVVAAGAGAAVSAGAVSLGVAGGVAVHTIDTRAEIRGGAKINDVSTRAFEDATVDEAARTIALADHGLVDGQAVVYRSEDTALRGLTSGSTYYVRVINADTIALALTREDALMSGTAGLIAIKDLAPGAAGTHRLEPVAATAGHQDVRVSASRQYDAVTVGAGLSGGATASGAIGVGVVALKGTTSALVTDAARVFARNDITVSAVADTDIVAVAAGIAGGKTFGGGGSFAVVTVDTTTSARITNQARAESGGNILVNAQDDTSVVTAAGNVAAGATGGVGGTLSLVSLRKSTLAFIDGAADVFARADNAAFDAQTNPYAAELTIPSDTAGGASRKLRGVGVVATSSEDVTAIAGAVGAGGTAGGALSLTFVDVDSDTFARIGPGAAVNVSGPSAINGTVPAVNAAQSVAVVATNRADAFSLAGGVGIGGTAGLAGGINLGFLSNNVGASIEGASQVRARDDVLVNAWSDWDAEGYAIGVGAGGKGGFGASVSVFTLGSDFNDSYDASGGSDNATQGAAALAGGAVSTLMSTLGQRAATDGEPALGTFGASGVNATGDTVTFDGANGLKTGDQLTYLANGGAPVGGLVSGATYYAIVVPADPANPSGPKLVKLAASKADAQAGRAIDLSSSTMTGTSHVFARNAAEVDRAVRANVGQTGASGRIEQQTLAGSTGRPPLGAFGAAAVNVATDEITVADAAGLKTGTRLIYRQDGAAPVQGLADGETYYAIVTATGSDGSAKIKLARTLDEARREDAAGIDIGTAGLIGSGHRFERYEGEVEAYRLAQAHRGPPQVAATAGTVAAVHGGAVVVAKDVAVTARQVTDLDIAGLAGGFGGLGGVGAGLSLATVDADASAYVASGASLSGLSTADRLGLVIDAGTTSSITSTAVAAGGGLYVGLGASVSVVRDTSSARAYLGASPNFAGADTDWVEGTGASLRNIGAVSVTSMVDATARQSVGALGAGAVGLGAAVVSSRQTVSSNAGLGAGTSLATDDNRASGTVTVAAQRNSAIRPTASGLVTVPTAIAVGGGVLGASAAVVDIAVGGSADARLGNGASVYTTGLFELRAAAQSHITDISVAGAALGVVAVGGVSLDVTVATNASASVGTATVRAGSVKITATQTIEATLSGVAASGGLLAGQVFKVSLTVKPVTRVSIGDKADVVATGAIEARASSTIDGSLSALVGAVGVGALVVGSGVGTIVSDTRVVIGKEAVLTAGTSLTAEAVTSNRMKVSAAGGTAGLIAGSWAEPKIASADSTLVDIGKAAALTALAGAVRLTAKGTHKLEADGETDGLTLVGGADTKARVNHSDMTAVSVAEDALVRAAAGEVALSTLVNLSLKAEAEADGIALAANTDALAVVDVAANAPAGFGSGRTKAYSDRTSVSLVHLDRGARIEGATVSLNSGFGTVETRAVSDADLFGGIGDTDSVARNTTRLVSEVDAEAGSVIRTGRLQVDAASTITTAFVADAKQDGGLGDTGDRTAAPAISLDRLIDFSSTVHLAGGVNDPNIQIDSNGVVTRPDGGRVADVAVSAGQIVIPNLIASSGVSGTAAFNAGQTPVTAAKVDGSLTFQPIQGTSVLKGAPVFNTLNGFETVTITNRSTRALTIQDIVTTTDAASVDARISRSAGDTSGFQFSNGTVTPKTKVVIQSIPGGFGYAANITFMGTVAAPEGSITVTASRGDILAAGNTQVLRADTVTMTASGAGIGRSSTPLVTDARLLNASASTDIYLSDLGDVEIGLVATTNTDRLASIKAAGAITGAATSPSHIVFDKVILSSTDGTVGTGQRRLEVRSEAVTATAADGIFLGLAALGSETSRTVTARTNSGGVDIVNRTGALQLGVVSAETGDVQVATLDDSANGQDIRFTAQTQVRAASGAVSLSAGDNITLVAGASIVAGGVATLGVDVGSKDTGQGGVLDIAGDVSASRLDLNGGGENDTITVRKLAAGLALSIRAGAGDDDIRIGSAPTATSQSTSVLSALAGSVDIDGGEGADTVTVDDSGTIASGSLELSASRLTGLSLPLQASIGYQGVEKLAILTGKTTGGTQRITGTSAVTSLTLGSGDDRIIVGGNVGVGAVARLVDISAGGGTNTLVIDDSGDTAANTGDKAGRVGGSSGNLITGLGLGGDKPLENGVVFSDIASVTVLLGKGATDVSVTAAAVETTIDARAGSAADTITIGDATDPAWVFSSLRAPVAVKGGGNDKVILRSTGTASDVILDRDVDQRVTASLASATAPFVRLENVAGTSLVLGDQADRVTVRATVGTLDIDAGGGNDEIRLDGTNGAVTIKGGAGDDTIALGAIGAYPLTIQGDLGNEDRVIVDRTTSTAAFDITVKDGTAAGKVVLQGLLAGSGLDLDGIEKLDLLLGTGNDTVTVDTNSAGAGRLRTLALTVDGGVSDDRIKVTSVGGPTYLFGGEGDDVVEVKIAGRPDAGTAALYSNLKTTITETLIVDNAGNSLATAWFYDGQTVFAAPVTNGVVGTKVTVLKPGGAEVVRIIGGTSGDDRLTLSADGDGITGRIAGDRVDLTGDPAIIRQINPATDFDQYGQPTAEYDAYGNMIRRIASFNGLTEGVAVHTEDALRFSTSSALGLKRAAAGALGLEARAPGDVTSLEMATTGTAGDIFRLDRATLSMASGSGTITFTVTTASGATVQQTFAVDATQRMVTFDAAFAAAKKVTWSASAGVIVDEVGATLVSAVVSETRAAVIPVYTLSLASGSTSITPMQMSSWMYDRWFSGAVLTVDLDGNGTTDKTITNRTDFIAAGNTWDFTVNGNQNAVLSDRVVFKGNLVIARNTVIDLTKIGAVSLSMTATNDITLGTGVVINASAAQQNAGAGGGYGGTGAVGLAKSGNSIDGGYAGGTGGYWSGTGTYFMVDSTSGEPWRVDVGGLSPAVVPLSRPGSNSTVGGNAGGAAGTAVLPAATASGNSGQGGARGVDDGDANWTGAAGASGQDGSDGADGADG
ncbi:MAG: beta strand repeat-containing protein, partial [Phreatobacter sp.]